MQLMQRDGGPGVWMQIHFFKNTYIFAFGLCGRLLEDGLHSLANATPCAEKQRTEHYVASVPLPRRETYGRLMFSHDARIIVIRNTTQ